jgi:hypothetical protein
LSISGPQCYRKGAIIFTQQDSVFVATGEPGSLSFKHKEFSIRTLPYRRSERIDASATQKTGYEKSTQWQG